MADPFITEQEVVDFLGRGDASDPGLSLAVEGACDIVRDVADQTITEASTTLVLDGTGTDTLLLPQVPVTNITQVTVDEESVTDYVLRDDGVLIRTMDVEEDVPSVAKWPAGRQNISIIHDTGYADADIPHSVRIVAISLAARLWQQGAAVQETIGQTSVKYAGSASDLTTTERIVLRKLKQAR